jgi:hypothetical protein
MDSRLNIPLKNGLPWTCAIKFQNPVNPYYMKLLKKKWEEIDWEDLRRPKSQSAIYKDTRTILWHPKKRTEIGYLSKLIFDEIKTFFPIEVNLLYTELTLLSPWGYIPWHHDELEICNRATRIIIPISEDYKNIRYYFSNWAENVPVDEMHFDPSEYLSNEKYELEFESGYYYMFNHRIPHMTISRSSKPRGALMLNVVSKESNYTLTDGWNKKFLSITEFEKTKIVSPIFN